jgi:5-formyltetrahydrofolate cyclo-ligase
VEFAPESYRNTPKIMSDKTSLRRTLLDIRNSTSLDLRAQWDTAIGNQIVAWRNRSQVITLGIYWPMRGEPDLRAAYAELAMQGVELALPVVVGKDAPLRFAAWKPGDTLVKDAMGVTVPAAAALLVQPEALLIPCVGFNAQRVRLGYGGGHYDRTLAISPRPYAIGVAYASALSIFDQEPHDIALDRIITEVTAASVLPNR